MTDALLPHPLLLGGLIALYLGASARMLLACYATAIAFVPGVMD